MCWLSPPAATHTPALPSPPGPSRMRQLPAGGGGGGGLQRRHLLLHPPLLDESRSIVSAGAREAGAPLGVAPGRPPSATRAPSRPPSSLGLPSHPCRPRCAAPWVQLKPCLPAGGRPRNRGDGKGGCAGVGRGRATRAGGGRSRRPGRLSMRAACAAGAWKHADPALGCRPPPSPLPLPAARQGLRRGGCRLGARPAPPPLLLLPAVVVPLLRPLLRCRRYAMGCRLPATLHLGSSILL